MSIVYLNHSLNHVIKFEILSLGSYHSLNHVINFAIVDAGLFM